MIFCLGAGVLVALTFGFSPASSQVLYGTLVGTVEHASGAVAAGVMVTATNDATGLSRETDTNGEYSFSNLCPASTT
jgi:hypothetical protein